MNRSRQVPTVRNVSSAISDTAEWQSATDAIQRLVVWGMGSGANLGQVMEQRLWRRHLHRFLTQEFPDLSAQECEDCVARHLERSKRRPGTSKSHAAW